MNSPEPTDALLGRQALAGDRSAFNTLLDRHESALFNVTYRLTGNREGAALVSQEAFLQVVTGLDDLPGVGTDLAVNLHRAALGLAHDRHDDDDLDDTDVGAANARLTAPERLALALRELQAMSYADIGRVLDIGPAAAAQLLVSGRLALHHELRLGEADLAMIDSECQGRLASIGALLDGQLEADRADLVVQHMELCQGCRAAWGAFEQARSAYRAWPVLPLIALGTATALAGGEATAPAAEEVPAIAAGVAPAFAGDDPAPLDRAAVRGAMADGEAGAGSLFGGLVGGFFGGNRRVGAMAGAGGLALLVLIGVSALVASRSGSPEGPLPLTPSVAEVGTTTARAPRAPVAPTTIAARTAATETTRTETSTTTDVSIELPPEIPVAAPSRPPSPAVTRAPPARPRRTVPRSPLRVIATPAVVAGGIVIGTPPAAPQPDPTPTPDPSTPTTTSTPPTTPPPTTTSVPTTAAPPTTTAPPATTAPAVPIDPPPP